MTAPPFSDPLRKLYPDKTPEGPTVKNPDTGLRESIDTLQRLQNRDDEVKRKKAMRKRVLVMLMQDDLGREWLFDLLVSCNIFGTPFTPDDRSTSYNCGALKIGRDVENELKIHARREYMQMCMEGWDRDEMWAMDASDK